MGHAVRYAGMLGGLGGCADTYSFNSGNPSVCYLNKPDCFIWEFKQNTIFSIMSILEECNSRLICAHKTQSMPLWLHFYKNITYVHICKHSNPMHESAHWQTHTHVMPLYLDSLAALWTLCSLFSKYRLIYAPCCLSEHIGHSIFSPITFYHSDREWLQHTGVHLKVLLRGIAPPTVYLSCMSFSNTYQVQQCLLKHAIVIVNHCFKKKRHVWKPLSKQLLRMTSFLLWWKWVRAKGRYLGQGGPQLLLVHVCCLSSIGQQLCGHSCWTTSSCKLVWYPSA